MAFQSLKAFVVANDDKAEIQNELNNLYALRDSLVLEIEKFKEEYRKVKDLSGDIKKLTEQKSILSSEVQKLIGDKNDLNIIVKDLSSAQEKFILSEGKLIDSIAKLTKDEKELTDNISLLKNSLSDKEKEYNNFVKESSHKAEAIKKECNDIEKDLKLLKSKRLELLPEIQELTTSVNSLKNTQLKLLSNNNALENKIKDSKKAIEILKQEYQKEVSDIKNKLVAEKNKANKEIEDMYSDAKKQMDLRDGNLSEKESWLEKKEDKLKQIKNDLEVFYGKKIDNIIF